MGMMSETEDVIDNALRPRELEGINGLVGSLRINWMRVRLFLRWSLEQARRVTRRAVWHYQARTLTCNRSGSAYDSVARTDLPNYMYALLLVVSLISSGGVLGHVDLGLILEIHVLIYCQTLNLYARGSEGSGENERGCKSDPLSIHTH